MGVFAPRKSRARRVLIVVAASLLTVLQAVSDDRRAEASATPTIADLQARYGASVYSGVVALRAASGAAGGNLVVNNTGSSSWTKCADLGLDLMATIVADAKGLVSRTAATAHATAVIGALAQVAGTSGIFPEVIEIGGALAPQVSSGQIRYSSIDSAWATVALGLVDAYYEGVVPALASQAKALLDTQDYRVFVGNDGLMGNAFLVDATSGQTVAGPTFSYGGANSEARPLVNALVGLGKLPLSAWNNMKYSWVSKHGQWLAQSTTYNSFEEMTGQVFLDESALAPKSLGRAHADYLAATELVASQNGDTVFGFAPACNLSTGYATYGLDQPDVVSPYAAGAVALVQTSASLTNLAAVLAELPTNGGPAPDGLVPATAATYCTVSRSLDQTLLFLELEYDTMWTVVERAAWFASAEQRIEALDQSAPAPAPAPAPALRPWAVLGLGATLFVMLAFLAAPARRARVSTCAP
jgi:hypothetical protein